MQTPPLHSVTFILSLEDESPTLHVSWHQLGNETHVTKNDLKQNEAELK